MSSATAFGGRVRLVLAVLALTGSLMLAGGSVASAGLVHPFVGSFGAFSNPQAVAVDQSTGNVFVIDAGSASVQKFDSSGSPSGFSAVGSNTLDAASGVDATPEGGFAFDSNSAAQVAVDNSGGATDGYLYVANSFAGVIDVFDSTGTFVGEVDGAAASPQSGFEACGVATDPAGNVYASYFEGHVDKYTPTDADPTHDVFEGQLENLGGVCNVAADGLGNVYVSTWSSGPLTKYDSSQFGQAAPSGTTIEDTSLAVAVDPTTNSVFVDKGDHIAQHDVTGGLAGQSGAGHLSGSSFGVAINGASGQLYASDAGAATVQQFGPAFNIDPPAVAIDQPSSVTSTHATFTGTVDPQGTDPLSDSTWHFEYSTDGGSTWANTTGGDAGTGTSPIPVSDEVNTFIPNQQVQVRLVAVNAAETTTSSEVSFTTTAIVTDVMTQPAQDISPTRAALSGLINPHNSLTTFYFEYGLTTAYGTSVPAAHDGDAGSDDVIGGEIQRIDGLLPGSTYHFRLVASNQAGTTFGQDQTFTTTTEPPTSAPQAVIAGTGFLPDQRGWEKVSPDSKNGGDIMADSQRVRAASDGRAVNFASLAAFGDAIGTSVATDYMSIRSSSGWTTHSITPPQAPLTTRPILDGLQSLYLGALSNDLSTGVFLAWSPLTADPNVANVSNIYLRNDLTTPGRGSYELLSACPACQSISTPLPAPPGNTAGDGQAYFAGASADFRHVIFESQEPRTSGAPGGCNNNLGDQTQCPRDLYEWDHGAVRLVGILPDSECSGAPPCPAHSSQAGQGAGLRVYTPHTISADGSRIFFTVPDEELFGSQTGPLYMRHNHTTTVKLNASERGAPDPGGPASAVYWDASTDGSRVFFSTTEALTDDAPANGGKKLYMYETSKPDSDSHNLTLLSAGVQTVLGASSDGHYVYFLAVGQLVNGQPVSGIDRSIYVWHDGTIRYIGPVGSSDDNEDTTATNWLLRQAVSRVTPDGKHLLFSSTFSGTGPTGYDQRCASQSGLCRQLYVYSYDSQRLACVSCNPSGTLAPGGAFTTVRTNNGAAYSTSAQNHPMSDDGHRVFFTTSDALVPQDVNGKLDVYEYDVTTGTQHLITNGRDPSDSYFTSSSASGNDAFFITRAQLTGGDVDNSYDLYDARVDGGFPEPPPTPPACTGEACRAPHSVTPSTVSSGTGSITQNGNVPTKPKAKLKPKRKACRRGYMRKKVHGKTRCVKAKKSRHRARKVKRAKRTNTVNRRAK